MAFLNGYFQAWKKLNPKGFGKVMYISYIHMFVNAVYILYALEFSLLV